MRRIAAVPASALAAVVVLAGCGGSTDLGKPSHGRRSPFRVAQGSHPAQIVPGSGSLTAYVPAPTPLRASPAGRALTTLPAKTEFGSPQVVAVVRSQGDWLGVLSSRLSNGRVGWIRAARARLFRVDYSIDVLLSRRELVVRHGSRVIARTSTAIGQPKAPTPRGLFAVTDRLLINQRGSPYVCCVLALNAHQPNVPQEWSGGDRIAIHATADPETIGQAVSLGCLRVRTAVMRRLVRAVPLGTPVRVRA